jgi:hypothetical protein
MAFDMGFYPIHNATHQENNQGGMQKMTTRQEIEQELGMDLDELVLVPGIGEVPLGDMTIEMHETVAKDLVRQGNILAEKLEKEHALAEWVEEQREAYRAGTLAAEHATKLEALPFWTWDAA